MFSFVSNIVLNKKDDIINICKATFSCEKLYNYNM